MFGIMFKMKKTSYLRTTVLLVIITAFLVFPYEITYGQAGLNPDGTTIYDNSPGSGYLGTQGKNDIYTQAFFNNPYGTNPVGPQVKAYTNGITSSGAGATSAIGKGVGSAASCISAAQVIRIAKEAIIKANPSTYTKVNTVTTNSFSEAGESGQTSFDSIGYCLLNAIIEYIANATIAWANSGFNGNPAFLADPQRFFMGLADQQVAGFIKDFNQTGAGLNIPPQFRGPISQGLLQGYVGSTRGGSLGGSSYGQSGLTAFSNPTSYGDSYLRAGSAMVSQQTQALSLANQQLSFGQGYLPAKNPGKTTQTKDANGNPVSVQQNAQIVTPASTLNSIINTRTNGGFNRLISATKFDQVVNSLVNALIKLVLSKVFSSK